MTKQVIHAKELAIKLGLKDLYLKYEGDNPTGTHKDRIAALHLERANGKKVVAASCGNLGVALAKKGSEMNTEVEIWIPESFESPRIEEIKTYGATVLRKSLSYEECVVESGKNAPYNANPGGENSKIEFEIYKKIGEEILNEIPQATAVGVPVSNGTTIVGISLSGLRVYAGSTKQNPIITSYLKGLKKCETLDPKSLIETSINEPLINWASIDGDEALHVLSGASGATDDELVELASQLPASAHPSSLAGLYALLRCAKDESCPVALITSRNY